MKVLFLGSVLPFPAHTGARVSQLIHLNELRSAAGVEVTAAFYDGDRTGAAISGQIARLAPKVVAIEARPEPRSFLARLSRGILAVFCTSLPPSIYERASPVACAAVVRLCREERFDAIVADSIDSMGLIPSPPPDGFPPVVMVTHNLEVILQLDVFRLLSWRDIRKFLSINNLIKTFCWERRYLARCARTVFISRRDLVLARRLYRLDPACGRFVFCQDILPLKPRRWRPAGRRRIVFVGGLSYPPNLDAALWLVNTLAPALERAAPEIRIAVAGNTSAPKFESAAAGRPNVEVHGRVDEKELEELMTSSALFLSPVERGSGVKMKLLTAVSYGMPLLATRHCLDGADFLGPEFEFERSDSPEGIARIIGLVRDPAALAEASRRVTLCAERALSERRHKLVETVRLAAAERRIA